MSGSDTPPIFDVFFKALFLAEQEGAKEIGIRHLLAALDSPAMETNLGVSSTGPFVPVPRVDKFLSSGAQAAIAALGNLDHMSIDSLRAVLTARRTESYS
jgi:hypothetical protein